MTFQLNYKTLTKLWVRALDHQFYFKKSHELTVKAPIKLLLTTTLI